jgi:hypothetical protein
VEHVRRTGEMLVTHPALDARIRVSSQRKDCPRVLTVALRRIEQTH